MSADCKTPRRRVRPLVSPCRTRASRMPPRSRERVRRRRQITRACEIVIGISIVNHLFYLHYCYYYCYCYYYYYYYDDDDDEYYYYYYYYHYYYHYYYYYYCYCHIKAAPKCGADPYLGPKPRGLADDPSGCSRGRPGAFADAATGLSCALLATEVRTQRCALPSHFVTTVWRLGARCFPRCFPGAASPADVHLALRAHLCSCRGQDSRRAGCASDCLLRVPAPGVGLLWPWLHMARLYAVQPRRIAQFAMARHRLGILERARASLRFAPSHSVSPPLASRRWRAARHWTQALGPQPKILDHGLLQSSSNSIRSIFYTPAAGALRTRPDRLREGPVRRALYEREPSESHGSRSGH